MQGIKIIAIILAVVVIYYNAVAPYRNKERFIKEVSYQFDVIAYEITPEKPDGRLFEDGFNSEEAKAKLLDKVTDDAETRYDTSGLTYHIENPENYEKRNKQYDAIFKLIEDYAKKSDKSLNDVVILFVRIMKC